MSVVIHQSLCRLVLDWMKRQMTEDTLSMTNLLERSHLLYLALDNSLQDCADLPPGHESESDLVQDYKRLVLKCPNNKGRRKQVGATGRPRVLIYSRDIGEREDRSTVEPDWNVIGSAKVGENTFISLITLNGLLTRVSIQLRLNLPQSTSSPTLAPDSAIIAAGPPAFNAVCNATAESAGSSRDDESLSLAEQPETFCEMAAMSGPKCGLGVAEWDGKLLICGGYNRGECLRSVESYKPETNEWTVESNMSQARGRVQIAVLEGTVYAVGGSNGECDAHARTVIHIELIQYSFNSNSFQAPPNWIRSNGWNRMAKNGTNAASSHWHAAMRAYAHYIAAYIALEAGMGKSVLNNVTFIVRWKTNGPQWPH